MSRFAAWKRLLTLVAISPLLTPTAVHAQKGYALGIGGGAAIPVGKLGDVQKTGYSAMLALAAGSPELPIGLRFDAIYNNLTHTDTPAGLTSADLRVAGVIVNL